MIGPEQKNLIQLIDEAKGRNWKSSLLDELIKNATGASLELFQLGSEYPISIYRRQ